MIKYCTKARFSALYAILYQGVPMPSDLMPPTQCLITLFTRQSCWMIEPLAAELGYSVPSARRFLNNAGYYSSFTHNGRWYTLRSIPRFNHDGLWFHDLIGFSRAGSLTATIIHLVTRSPGGMTAQQLGEKLNNRCHSVLVQLWRRGKLERRKSGRLHVYLAVDPPIQSGQLLVMADEDHPTAPLPAEIAVFVLAEVIRHPELNFEQLATTVGRRRRIPLKATQVEALFALHSLKKTTQPAAPLP